MIKKLKIAFINTKRYSFYPPDYLNRGLGGTESSLVLISEALAKRGHIVDVYNCCFKEGLYNNVYWKQLWKFDETKKYDVIISLRFLEIFKEYKFNSPIKAVWVHDESLQGATLLDRKGDVNMWISVSNTQKKFIEKKESIKKNNWFVTRNAFDEKLYNNKLRKIKKKKNQIIYCSAPDRGLKYLLNFWPEIKQKIPDAKLIVTGSYALWGTSDEENARIFQDIYKKASYLKDVSILQRLSKNKLAKLQAESELMLYPTDFNEMFCISALECLSVGTPVISSARAAMNERIRDSFNGFLIAGKCNSLAYRKKIIKNTCDFLISKKNKKSFSKNSIASVSKMGFAELAKEWELEFIKRLK